MRDDTTQAAIQRYMDRDVLDEAFGRETMGEELTRLARKGFEAYNEAAGGLNYEGKPIPPWDEVPQHIRDKWKVATYAIILQRHKDVLADAVNFPRPPIPVVSDTPAG